MTGPQEHGAALDGSARLAAKREFDRPVVLEAGAGTGKTATLVARVVCWCLGPGWERASTEARNDGAFGRGNTGDADGLAARVLGGISAITFTEAASAEMAARVGAALAELQSGGLPLGVDEEDLGLAPEERALRARALRAHVERLEVRTIHAFCRRLLAEHPMEASLAPGFEVDADETRLERALRSTLERTLRRGLEQPVDEDLVALASEGVGPAEIEASALELVRRGARSTDLADDPLGPEALAPVVDGLRVCLAELEPLARPMRGGRSGETLEAVRGSLALFEAPSPDRAEFLALVGRLRELWPDLTLKRLAAWSKSDLGKTDAALVAEHTDELAHRARLVRDRLEGLLSLEPRKLDAGRRVVASILRGVEEALASEGVVTFADLLTGARRLLEEHPAIARRVRERIDLLLVDEFQDTDSEQCAVLRRLALTGEVRPSLFLVGDPKQSIYGWRSADLAAYDAFVEDVRAAGGVVHALSRNFRSRPAILDEVRRVVEPIMERHEGVQPHFEGLLAVREAAEDGPDPVEYWVSWTAEDGRVSPKSDDKGASYELEARTIAHDIARLHADGLPWRDFALLFRATGNVDLYLQALRERGIPYAVQRDRSYYQRREVIDASAALRCVLDPADHLALATFLRSPMCGVPDAALEGLWERDLPALLEGLRGRSPELEARVAATVEEAAAALPEDVPGLDAVADWRVGAQAALAAVAELRASFESDPADVFVERLRALLLPDAIEAARYLGAFRLANLERFYRGFVATLESERGDTQALLRSLRTSLEGARPAEEARPPDAARDAVQILTYHGSKGLEFPCVYLPQLHRNSPADSPPENHFERTPGGCEYALFGSPTPGYGSVRERARRVEAAERVRLLYVALTRAEERLVLCGSFPDPKEKRKPWQRCRQLVQLLAHRGGALEATRQLSFCEGDPTPWVDAHGVRWSLPGLSAPGASRAAVRGAESEPVDAGGVVDASEALAAARARALRHRSRPFSAAPSAMATDPDGEAAAPSTRRHGGGALEREAARLAGTLVHRALECLDLDAPAEDELERRLDELSHRAEVAAPPETARAVQERAREVLANAASHGLIERLRSLGENVLARELPILVAPDREGGEETGAPVSFHAGAIDLVYRDPDDGRLVVADFKTDRADEEGGEDGDLVERYRQQGAHYVRAVARALSLEQEPRFELWLLDAGRVLSVPL